MEEEALNKESECQMNMVEESKYFPPELLHGILLAVRIKLEFDDKDALATVQAPIGSAVSNFLLLPSLGLEAMRTKKCLEKFHLESLEKLGEFFPKDLSIMNRLILKHGSFLVGEAEIKSKRVADVLEALIGAYLSSDEEVKTLSFMKRLGLEIDFANAPMLRHFPMNAEKLVNVRYLESLLHYKFHDPSLLFEELTHASYMLP
ncbi:hypothetical protein T459_02222 [Capsicum annuum]|uniref:RNase III domain-containing protein n=1 Tax=Capsicum annuum TaxID=4072 RepID=A0A2G3AJG1_CAPAN|nr:hypothetical protein FXO37_05456 [Capsicum annuum]PHT94340.1 hypothetical protein T459_02222 [Capsicum annuum]